MTGKAAIDAGEAAYPPVGNSRLAKFERLIWG